MRKVVIYPGRFHPFHKGHKATYDFLVKKYGAANVFIASTNTQAPMSSPFSFDQKKQMMTALGVPASQIEQVKSPYVASEITSKFDPEKTVVIFALSEKDADRISYTKKDGTPAKMQPLAGKPEAAIKHHYVEIAPTVDFMLNGNSVNSASSIREMYAQASDEQRMNIIKGLYGKADNKIKEIFDSALQIAEALQRLQDGVLMESMDPEYLRIIREVAERERTALKEHELN